MYFTYSYADTFIMKQFTKLIIRKLIHLITGLLVFVLTFILAREILLWFIVAGTLFSFLTFNYG